MKLKAAGKWRCRSWKQWATHSFVIYANAMTVPGFFLKLILFGLAARRVL